jgi:hypothetical protein
VRARLQPHREEPPRRTVSQNSAARRPAPRLQTSVRRRRACLEVDVVPGEPDHRTVLPREFHRRAWRPAGVRAPASLERR